MGIYCIKYGVLKKHFFKLSSIPLSACWSGDNYCEPNGTLASLSPNDEVFLFSSKRALTFSRHELQAKVSLLVAEPVAVQKRLYQLLPYFERRFHRIATHANEILVSCTNAEKWVHGGRWVPLNQVDTCSKPELISIIASKKKSSEGHKLRHELIEYARDKRISLKTFGKGYQYLDNKQDGHLPFRFSVIIENSKSDGYFTEKLIDAILCGSIPIYWGDPSVGKYFNLNGFIQCQNLEDLKLAIENVTVEMYDRMAPITIENKARASDLLECPISMTKLAGPKIFDI